MALRQVDMEIGKLVNLGLKIQKQSQAPNRNSYFVLLIGLKRIAGNVSKTIDNHKFTSMKLCLITKHLYTKSLHRQIQS